MDDDTPIDAKILSGAIENAQKKVESRNFQARKNTLEYDDVMNVQREVIYEQRRQVLDGENMGQFIRNMIHRWIDTSIHGHLGENKHLSAESYQLATEPFRGLFFPPDAVPIHRRRPGQAEPRCSGGGTGPGRPGCL